MGESADDFNALDFLLGVRGGLPEQCDWCGHKFIEGDAIHPEEAGEWICQTCLENDPFYNDQKGSR